MPAGAAGLPVQAVELAEQACTGTPASARGTPVSPVRPGDMHAASNQVIMAVTFQHKSLGVAVFDVEAGALSVAEHLGR